MIELQTYAKDKFKQIELSHFEIEILKVILNEESIRVRSTEYNEFWYTEENFKHLKYLIDKVNTSGKEATQPQ